MDPSVGNNPIRTEGQGMFWQGFIIGIFLGASVGIVVAGLIVSAKRQNHADKDNPECELPNTP